MYIRNDKHFFSIPQEKKIFSIHGYYPIISEELKKRGWIEKRDPEFKPLNYDYLVTTQSTTSK